MRNLIIFCFLFCGGCREIVDDPNLHIDPARTDSITLHTPDFNDVQVDVMFQDGANSHLTAEHVANVIHATFRAWESHFNWKIPANMRHFTVLVVRGNSSQWPLICGAWRYDACSDVNMIPHFESDWQMVIRDNTSDQDNGGVFIHEMLHGIQFYAWGDKDYDHLTPGVWENGGEHSVYHDAMYLAN